MLLIVQQILKMLIILMIGYLCFRLKVIDRKGNQAIANLLLLLVNPAVAIMALQIDYSPQRALGLGTAFLMALISHLTAIAVSQITIPKRNNPDYGIERFSIVYSNCGFIGIPLISSALGDEGVFYLTAYILTFNLLSWTHGLILMTGKASFSSLKKGLSSPMIISCFLGVILFFTRIRIPAVPAEAIRYISSMNTPLAMLIAGVSVAQTDLLKMFKMPKVYVVSALKLIVVPLLVLGILSFLPVSAAIYNTILIATACPVAATGTAFALRYEKNYSYSSQLYAFSTLMSLVTIPFLLWIAEHFSPLL